MELKPIPNEEWRQKFDKVMLDPYIKKKYNREKRIQDKNQYISSYLPRIRSESNLSILDIGPGPGEFMEICQEYGHTTKGIDGLIENCEMGNEYMILSSLFAERQELDISYTGLNIQDWGYEDSQFDIINSQGSIEQVFRDYLVGIPHKVHKDCRKLNWREDDKTEDAIRAFVSEAYRCLKPLGTLCIFANNNRCNFDYYLNALLSACGDIGLSRVQNRKFDRKTFERLKIFIKV